MRFWHALGACDCIPPPVAVRSAAELLLIPVTPAYLAIAAPTEQTTLDAFPAQPVVVGMNPRCRKQMLTPPSHWPSSLQ
jgi:hypothetical protein